MMLCSLTICPGFASIPCKVMSILMLSGLSVTSHSNYPLFPRDNLYQASETLYYPRFCFLLWNSVVPWDFAPKFHPLCAPLPVCSSVQTLFSNSVCLRCLNPKACLRYLNRVTSYSTFPSLANTTSILLFSKQTRQAPSYPVPLSPDYQQMPCMLLPFSPTLAGWRFYCYQPLPSFPI